MALLGTVMCLKNTNMPIHDIKQYIDWVIEGASTVGLRLDMLNKHKQAVLAEMALMTESLEGIEVKIQRYIKQTQEALI